MVTKRIYILICKIHKEKIYAIYPNDNICAACAKKIKAAKTQ